MKNAFILLSVLFISTSVMAQRKLYVLSKTDHTIYSVKVKNTDSEPKAKVLKGGDKAIAPYDIISLPGKNLIYWIDPFTKAVSSINKNGNDLSVVDIDSIGTPVDIDLDYQTGQIYWLEHTGKIIYRADWNGANAEKFIVDSMSIPSAIALNLTANKIYWADLRLKKIFSRSLDGGPVETVQQERVDFPLRLAVDEVRQQLYWTDDIQQKIFRLDLKSGALTEIFTGSGTEYPFALYIDQEDEKLYWTDYGAKKVRRSNLDGSEIEDVMTDIGEPLGLTIVDPSNGGEAEPLATLRSAASNTRLEVLVFPNPASNELNISTNDFSGEQKLIQLYTFSGRLAGEYKTSTAAIAIPLEGMPSGQYICKVSKADEVVTEKLLISK